MVRIVKNCYLKEIEDVRKCYDVCFVMMICLFVSCECEFCLFGSGLRTGQTCILSVCWLWVICGSAVWNWITQVINNFERFCFLPILIWQPLDYNYHCRNLAINDIKSYVCNFWRLVFCKVGILIIVCC